jgi:hypothetical protein
MNYEVSIIHNSQFLIKKMGLKPRPSRTALTFVVQ